MLCAVEIRCAMHTYTCTCICICFEYKPAHIFLPPSPSLSSFPRHTCISPSISLTTLFPSSSPFSLLSSLLSCLLSYIKPYLLCTVIATLQYMDTIACSTLSFVWTKVILWTDRRVHNYELGGKILYTPSYMYLYIHTHTYVYIHTRVH